MACSFFVKGRPIPSPRPQVIGMGAPCPVCKKRPHTRVVLGRGATVRLALEWKSTVTRTARVQSGAFYEDTPLVVRLLFFLPPPPSLLRKDGSLRKGARRRPIGARDGDPDNLAKTVLDGLTGVLFADDSLVIDIRVVKLWAIGARRPGVEVTCEPY